MTTLLEKIKLLRGLLTGERAFTGPFHVTVDLTRRCNLQCFGCRYHSPQVDFPSSGDQAMRDIPFDVIKKLCVDLKAMGTSDLILTGEGEPLLYPHFFDVVSEIKETGFYLILITNGTLLNEDTIRALMDARLDALRVSLWASLSDQYQQFHTGTNPDNFRKVVEGLKLLRRLKAERKSAFPIVRIHYVINRHNFWSIEEIVDLARTTGCDALSFAPFKTWRGQLTAASLSPEEEKSLELSLLRVRKRLQALSIKHNINDVILRYRIGEAVWKKLPCYIAWFHARIKLDGVVLPCDPCDLPMGNLNENRFPEIWNGSAYRAFRRSTFTCEGLAIMSAHCDCCFCCHLVHNARTHRIFRWASPFARQFRNWSSISRSR